MQTIRSSLTSNQLFTGLQLVYCLLGNGWGWSYKLTITVSFHNLQPCTFLPCRIKQSVNKQNFYYVPKLYKHNLKQHLKQIIAAANGKTGSICRDVQHSRNSSATTGCSKQGPFTCQNQFTANTICHYTDMISNKYKYNTEVSKLTI
jgi:hypothetical protein